MTFRMLLAALFALGTLVVALAGSDGCSAADLQPSLIVPPHGRVGSCHSLNLTSPVGFTCVMACEPGYIRSGGEFTCKQSAGNQTRFLWEGDRLSCSPDNCAPLDYPIANGSVGSCGREIAHGKSCSLECNPGFRPEPAELFCDAGRLDYGQCIEEPPCIAPPPVPSNATLHGGCAYVASGGRCDLICNDGFVPADRNASFFVCRSGQWEGAPACVVAGCEPMDAKEAPEHGSLGGCGARTANGQSCSFECESGFRLRGGAFAARCVNEKWEMSEPRQQCVNTCLPLNASAVAHGRPGDCGKEVEFGKACNVTCDAGYELAGGAFVCNAETGQLEGQQSCVAKPCTAPPEYDSKQMTLNCPLPAEEGTECLPVCKDTKLVPSQPFRCVGQRWTPGKKDVYCRAPFSCELDPESLPEHATIGTCDSVEHRKICSIACEEGYQVSGSALVCRDGTFEGEQSCVKATVRYCPELSHHVAVSFGNRGSCASVTIPVGEPCYFQCDPGAVLFGKPYVCVLKKNEADWELSDPSDPPYCIPGCKYKGPLPPHTTQGNCTAPDEPGPGIAFGASCSYACEDGYQLSEDSDPALTCSPDNERDGDTVHLKGTQRCVEIPAEIACGFEQGAVTVWYEAETLQVLARKPVRKEACTTQGLEYMVRWSLEEDFPVDTTSEMQGTSVNSTHLRWSIESSAIVLGLPYYVCVYTRDKQGLLTPSDCVPARPSPVLAGTKQLDALRLGVRVRGSIQASRLEIARVRLGGDAAVKAALLSEACDLLSLEDDCRRISEAALTVPQQSAEATLSFLIEPDPAGEEPSAALLAEQYRHALMRRTLVTDMEVSRWIEPSSLLLRLVQLCLDGLWAESCDHLPPIVPDGDGKSGAGNIAAFALVAAVAGLMLLWWSKRRRGSHGGFEAVTDEPFDANSSRSNSYVSSSLHRSGGRDEELSLDLELAPTGRSAGVAAFPTVSSPPSAASYALALSGGKVTTSAPSASASPSPSSLEEDEDDFPDLSVRHQQRAANAASSSSSSAAPAPLSVGPSASTTATGAAGSTSSSPRGSNSSIPSLLPPPPDPNNPAFRLPLASDSAPAAAASLAASSSSSSSASSSPVVESRSASGKRKKKKERVSISALPLTSDTGAGSSNESSAAPEPSAGDDSGWPDLELS